MMDFWLMFVLGVVSSLHCVQMCGPIVLSYSAAAGFTPQSVAAPRSFQFALVPQHLAYHAGRILTYMALGAVAGLFGRSVEFIGRLAGISKAAMILSGFLMIAAGLLMFGSSALSSRLGSASVQLTSRLLRPLRSLLASCSTVDRFYLGLGLGLLPCGLVYMALLRSIATGTAVSGALSMLAFGLGTSGALIALGIFSSALKLRLNRFGSRIAAAGVIALGIFLLWRGSLPTTISAAMQGCHGHH